MMVLGEGQCAPTSLAGGWILADVVDWTSFLWEFPQWWRSTGHVRMDDDGATAGE